MKKLTFITLSFLLFSVSFGQSQIPNGDLELWTDTYNAENWNSINFGFPLNVHSAQQSTDSYQGSYAVDLTTESSLLGLVPGLITLGEIDLDNFTITGGIPFSERPAGISYYFKYTPVNNDTMFFAALLTKWNTSNQETDTIGFTTFFTDQLYDAFTYVAVPFVYFSDEIPDTINVLMTSSGFSGNEGSKVIADEIMLEYGTVVSPTICFPAADTTSTQFTANWLSFPDASSYDLDVSESSDFSSYLTGYENLDTGTDTFYITDITPGIYFYRVRVNYGADVSINSNTIAVPAPTFCLEATNIHTNGFTANWEGASNATKYYVDVAEDADFTNILTAYNNYDAGTDTQLIVTGLSPNTQYFYRLRVEYGSYISKNSNVIALLTNYVNVNTYNFDLATVKSVNNNIFININDSYDIKSVLIFDIKGNLIEEIIRPSVNEVVAVRNKGIYIVQIRTKDSFFSKKISAGF